MNLDTGSVVLRLHIRHLRVAEANIDCCRPSASRLLIGRSAEEAATLVPLLFAVCGKAQGLAAQLALKAAQGKAVAPHQDSEVAREAAREHLWHLLPETAHRPLLAQGTRCLNHGEGISSFLASALGMEVDRWVALDVDGLNGWLIEQAAPLPAAFRAAHPRLDEIPASAVPLLPPLDAEHSLALWPRLDADFAARPTWQGGAAETGALARCDGRFSSFKTSPLLQRRLARLTELAAYARDDRTWPHPGTASAAPVSAGRGRALVETARGLLMHEVAWDGERITDYQIVAPTEWNFHPQGALAAWLEGLPAAEESALQEGVRRRVTALDPCVPWRTELVRT